MRKRRFFIGVYLIYCSLQTLTFSKVNTTHALLSAYNTLHLLVNYYYVQMQSISSEPHNSPGVGSSYLTFR